MLIIGRQIRLLRGVKNYPIGTVGEVVSHCGCISLPKITVVMPDGDEIIIMERLTKGYEHYEVL
jgi:hypothetical protein